MSTTVKNLKVGQKFATNELGMDHWTVTGELPSGKLIAESTTGRKTIVPDNCVVFSGSEVALIED